MNTTGRWFATLSLGFFLIAMGWMGCSSVQEQTKTEVSRAVKEPSKSTRDTVKKSTKKVVEVEGVLSYVGQRTITFQVERKGRVREEVLGVDDKTRIEKSGNKAKLADLRATDKALIAYEPDAYTPALAIKVTGAGKIQKVGGDD